jgi:hypothetical protein
MTGIARIDQPHKHNHGFFVRVQRARKIHSAFFADKKHGGRRKALAAAQAHGRKLRRKLGPSSPRNLNRRRWAQIRRRKGSSAIVGVQKCLMWRGDLPREYWLATWSPRPYVVARKMFSVRKHGYSKAKQLAIQARRAGLQNME